MAETPFMSAYLSAANRVAKTVVGRGKWPGLIELFGAVLTADPSRHTRRPAVMPPAARIATHMCSKREPFSATKVRQTIRSFTHHRRGWAFGHTVNVDDQLYSRVGFATKTDHSTPAATRPCQSIRPFTEVNPQRTVRPSDCLDRPSRRVIYSVN